MPRFVVLEHHHQGVHWDFMLESGDALRTWKLASEPAAGPAIAATPLPDHRLLYLDYEGEISGGRGFVTQWDRGEFEWVSDGDADVVIWLAGTRLCGRAHLSRSDSGAWLLALTSSESSD